MSAGFSVRVLGPVVIDGPNGQMKINGSLEAGVLALLAVSAPQALSKEWLAEHAWGTPNGATVHTGMHRLKDKLGGTGIIGGTEYALDVTTDFGTASAALARGRAAVNSSDYLEAAASFRSGLELWRGTAPDGTKLKSDTREGVSVLEAIPRLRCDLASALISTLAAQRDDTELLRVVDEFIRRDPVNRMLHTERANSELRLNGRDAAVASVDWSFDEYQRAEAKFPESLIAMRRDLLTGNAPSAAAAERVKHNLPGARYTSFIHGSGEIERLTDGLNQGRPILALTAMPGRGRSVIAHYFAGKLVANGAPFNAIAWISDEKTPGALTLGIVLDALVPVVGGDFDKLAPAPRAQAITNELSLTPTLIVIDTEAGIDDEELLEWLSRVSSPSKVLLTTTAVPPALEHYAFIVKVAPPQDRQRRQFLAGVLEAQPIGGATDADDPKLKQIWDLVHGNYKDLVLQLGRARRIGLVNVIAELEEDPSRRTVLRRLWEPLNHTERAIMLLLSCFRHGASFALLEELAGDLPDFELSLFTLVDLGLVTSAGQENMVYDIEPSSISLVDPARRKDDPDLGPIVERWLEYCVNLAESVGFHPDELHRLDVLDPATVRPNIEFALRWAIDNDRPDQAITIAREVRYYYYVRGLWTPSTDVNLLRAEVARAIGDREEEFTALVYKSNIAAKQGNVAVFEGLAGRIRELLESGGDGFSTQHLAQERHARALMLHTTGRHLEAEELWERNLATPDDLGPFDLSANLRWWGVCLSEQNDPDKRAQGVLILESQMKAASDNARVKAMSSLQLISRRLDRSTTPEEARPLVDELTELEDFVLSLRDARYTADHAHLTARGLEMLGDPAAEEKRRRAEALYAELDVRQPGEEHVS